MSPKKSTNTSFIVSLEFEGKRILSFLKEKLKDKYKTDDIRFALEHNRLKVNGSVERFESRKVKEGDKVEITIEKKPDFSFDPARVLFEDASLCIYNKPAGIPVTESWGLSSLLSLSTVHRLDRDTSGVIIFAKDKKMQNALEELFRKREVTKSYLAIVHDTLSEKKGIIENYLGKIKQRQGEVTWGIVPPSRGLLAKTTWMVEKSGKEFSMLRCFPLTGRTHQIRVHLSNIGHPILGDVQYGPKSTHRLFSPFRPLLHAERISFLHPFERTKITVSAPLPPDFHEALNYF